MNNGFFASLKKKTHLGVWDEPAKNFWQTCTLFFLQERFEGTYKWNPPVIFTKVSFLGDGHLIGVVPSFCTLHGFSQTATWSWGLWVGISHPHIIPITTHSYCWFGNRTKGNIQYHNLKEETGIMSKSNSIREYAHISPYFDYFVAQKQLL